MIWLYRIGEARCRLTPLRRFSRPDNWPTKISVFRLNYREKGVSSRVCRTSGRRLLSKTYRRRCFRVISRTAPTNVTSNQRPPLRHVPPAQMDTAGCCSGAWDRRVLASSFRREGLAAIRGKRRRCGTCVVFASRFFGSSQTGKCRFFRTGAARCVRSGSRGGGERCDE